MLREYLSGLANAFRAVLGTTGKINAQNFADKVDEVYEKGYAQGAADNIPSVDPNWTNWQYAFSYGRGSLLKKFKFSDTSKATNLEYAFAYSTDITSVPSFDVKNVTSVLGLFSESTLVEAPELDLSNITNAGYMFNKCSKLVSVPEYTFADGITRLDSMFYSCGKLKSIGKLSNTQNATTTQQMFYMCGSLNTTPEMDTSGCKTFIKMFYYSQYLTKVTKINLSSATNLTDIFGGCIRLTDIGIEGTIPISLSVSSCPLTSDCAKNILKALKEYIGTTNVNKYTITLKSTVKDALIAEGATAPDGLTWDEYVTTVKGWNW